MNHYYIGIIYIIGYIIVISVGDVWISLILENKNVFDMTLPVFIITMLVFFILSIKENKWDINKFNLNLLKLIFKINVYTAGNWILSFWALKYLTPYSFNSILLISTAFICNIMNKNFIVRKKLLLFILILVCFIIFREYNSQGFSAILYSILGIIAAISTYLMMKETRHLYSYGLTVYQTLSFRFIITILISFTLSDINQVINMIYIDNIVNLLMFTVIVSIIPIFLISSSLAYINEQTVSNIIPLIPVTTFGIQLILDTKFLYNFVSFMLALISSILLLYIEVTKNDRNNC